MKMSDLIVSEQLTKKAAFRIMEALLAGEITVNVDDGEILCCYGQAPQSMASIESVLDCTTVDEYAKLLDNDYGCMGGCYAILKQFTKVIGVETPKVMPLAITNFEVQNFCTECGVDISIMDTKCEECREEESIMKER